MSALEVSTCLISAAIHDVAHPGKNNQYLINNKDKLAIRYNDKSVLENYHVAEAFKLLEDDECNFMTNLDADQYKAVRSLMISMVLATDMTHHFSGLGRFRDMFMEPSVTDENKG